MTVPYSTKTITECTKTDSLISSDSSLARTQSIANGGSVSSTQQQELTILMDRLICRQHSKHHIPLYQVKTLF